MGFNSKKEKYILISIIAILSILIMLAMYFWIINPGGKKSRTIMIYMVGSNLESNAGIATADLNSIDPSKIDLNKTNILLYTGGTESWQNYIKNDENAIYLLKENGFEKIESYEKYNMGSEDTLASFLNYSYDNYKAKNYNLILYDHGGAIDGAIYDDFTDDNLSLLEFENALEKSPFNEKNKLQTVVFRTCLNGTIEVANTFSKYAEYLVASEEVTRGSRDSYVFASLNNVLPNDDGVEFGKKFIDNYVDYMKKVDVFDSFTTTYSILDLSYVDSINEKINNYFNSIDIKNNYDTIAKSRSQIFTYGDSQSEYYSTIDIYNFVNNTKSLSNKYGEELLSTLDKAVVYNYSNKNNSKGLSIYFPYGGNDLIRNKFFQVYSNIKGLNAYNTFIKSFDNIKNGKKTDLVDFSKTTTAEDDNIISLKLTDEQNKYFSKAKIGVFKRDEKHPNYYQPLLTRFTSKPDSNGTISVSLKDAFVKVVDESYEDYVFVFENEEGLRSVSGFLYDNSKEIGSNYYMNRVDFLLEESNSGIKVNKAKLNSKNGRIDGIILDVKDYDRFEIYNQIYKMLDKDGKFTGELEGSPELVGVDGKPDKINLKKSKLENGEFYYVFIINDINGNVYYSDFKKLGE